MTSSVIQANHVFYCENVVQRSCLVSRVIGNWLLQVGRDRLVRIDVEKSSYHHLSQSEIGALAQGMVEIVISIGELQGLKPFFSIYSCRPRRGDLQGLAVEWLGPSL